MGEIFAVGCALSWSIAVILFKKTSASVHPITMNLFKNTLGMILLIPTGYLATGSWTHTTETSDLLILTISGFLGIGIADFLALKALRMIGAGRYAVVECIYSPVIVTLSLLFLAERLSLLDTIGAGFIVMAVIMVNLPDRKFIEKESTEILKGSIIGGIGIVLMGIGVVIIKPVFERVPLLWVIELRMLAGVVASLILFLLFKKRTKDIVSIFYSDDRNLMITASLFSAYISMIMWVAGFKYMDVSGAAILNQTATIFTVILATVVLKEKLTPKRIAATFFAFGGVVLMTV